MDSECSDGTIISGDWREIIADNNGGLRDINCVRGHRPRTDATQIRDDLKDFFNSEIGSVEWQLRHVRKTSTFVIMWLFINLYKKNVCHCHPVNSVKSYLHLAMYVH